MVEPEHRREHHHEHVHMDEADWRAAAAQTELEGEVLLAFVTDAAAWVTELRGPDAPPVRRVIDIGSGPGVGTCELARQFRAAQIIAVDGSPAMLDRATRRAAEQGLESRISTRIAALPDGLDGLEPVDVIWASMSLHHIGDEVTSLRILHDLLNPGGHIAIAERAEPMRVLPDDLALGHPGLVHRLDRAGTEWFAGMRAGLAESVPSVDLPSMVTAAGFEVVGSRLARERVDAPLADDARRLVLGHLCRTREQYAEHLDSDDLRALATLTDTDDPQGVMHRSDVFVEASRQIVVARPIGGR